MASWIGGCAEIILLLISSVVNIVSSKQFTSSMLRKLYLIKNYAPITELERMKDTEGRNCAICVGHITDYFSNFFFSENRMLCCKERR